MSFEAFLDHFTPAGRREPALDGLAIKAVARAYLKRTRDFVLFEQAAQGLHMELQEFGDFRRRPDVAISFISSIANLLNWEARFLRRYELG